MTVLSDEIHAELAFEGRRHIPLASLSHEFAQNTITFISPSKAFNLAGLCASVVIIPNDELRSRFLEVTDGTMGDINVFGLRAMEVAYQDGDEWLNELLRYIEGKATCLCRFLEEKIPEIRAAAPEGTYLVWLDCRSLGLSSDTLERLFQEVGVGMMSGTAFGPGGGGFMRINVACPRSLLVEALRRIECVVESLRAGREALHTT